ncbi:hypothetical protein F0562_030752 [Nyssa sinensis]|uniref:Uncharacterized protein n=1 Tax=Nyssa sinensis TaxID=561372 RepID=A0A5J5B0P0_9ASTE|nr:hypothetical protein F0562_030752 [Nyssa sinensis]
MVVTAGVDDDGAGAVVMGSAVVKVDAIEVGGSAGVKERVSSGDSGGDVGAVMGLVLVMVVRDGNDGRW